MCHYTTVFNAAVYCLVGAIQTQHKMHSIGRHSASFIKSFTEPLPHSLCSQTLHTNGYRSLAKSHYSHSGRKLHYRFFFSSDAENNDRRGHISRAFLGAPVAVRAGACALLRAHGVPSDASIRVLFVSIVGWYSK